MSELETAVRPILEPMLLGKGLTVILSPDDQVILSRWAYKSVLVANLALPEASLIPNAFYNEFYHPPLLPEQGVTVWTAAYSAQARWGHFTRVSLPLPEAHARLATFSVFRALFQVLLYFGGDWRQTRDGGLETEPLIQRLWPPTKTPIAWPKDQKAIGSFSSLKYFCQRIDFI